MKPAWDQLAEEYESNADIAIVDVDCTASGSESLCEKYGVRGYPTIKYITGTTDPMGDDYEGGRSFDDLKTFVTENLGPSCGPDHMDLCSDEQKAELEKVMASSDEDLEASITEKTDAIAAAEKNFSDELEKLQASYEKLVEEKDATIAAINPDLRVMRVVKASRAKAAEGKDEL